MIIILLLTAYGHAAGVKTSYKQYSVFAYEDEKILCEPYQVKKDDWLYKILRQKGEISEADFPRFLNIFKKINPRINNIDTIAPGITILIPLKKIDPQNDPPEQSSGQTGVVQVPVVEFSSTPPTFDIAPFVRKHMIETGDTVSTLMGKEFLKKSGAISGEGKIAFGHLNPGVKNIDLIYQGTQVVIPDPSILAQPWFNYFLKQGRPGTATSFQVSGQVSEEKGSDPILQVISPQQMIQLKRYAALIQGTLINQGQMVFPGKTSQPDLVLDLAQTPLIESKKGEKTLIFSPNTPNSSLGNDIVNNIKAHWKQIKIKEIDKAIAMAVELGKENNSLTDKPRDAAKLISTLLSVTATPYTPETISFFLGTIEMNASFGRIARTDEPDLLVNMGNVYGLALEAIEKKGTPILTISPGLTMSEIILTLFTRLGYSTWKNPSFTTSESVQIIPGIYVTKDKEKLLFTRQRPNTTALSFLEQENIQFLILNQ